MGQTGLRKNAAVSCGDPGFLQFSRIDFMIFLRGNFVLQTCRPTFIFEIITFLIQKHFKTVTVTVILGKINSNYFQDGNWEPMQMKG